MRTLDFERKSASIVLFTVRFRSCLSVFKLYSFSSSPSAIFWECSHDKLRFRLDIIYGVMPRPKRKEKLVKVWLRESVYSVWKSKKDLARYGNNTNSEFAEFLLHHESSASSQHNGNSNMSRRKEITLHGVG